MTFSLHQPAILATSLYQDPSAHGLGTLLMIEKRARGWRAGWLAGRMFLRRRFRGTWGLPEEETSFTVASRRDVLLFSFIQTSKKPQSRGSNATAEQASHQLCCFRQIEGRDSGVGSGDARRKPCFDVAGPRFRLRLTGRGVAWRGMGWAGGKTLILVKCCQRCEAQASSYRCNLSPQADAAQLLEWWRSQAAHKTQLWARKRKRIGMA